MLSVTGFVQEAFGAWAGWYPPNGFNCLCTVMSVSESLLRRRGWRLVVSNVRDEPDDGFTTNPARTTPV